MLRPRHALLALLVLGALLLLPSAPVLADDGPSRLELDGARHRVEIFEQHVKLARGQPFDLGHDEKEALKRVGDLHDKYPDNPEVKELFERTRQALLASKGKNVELPPDALEYRKNEQRLKELFFEAAKKEWDAWREKALAAEGAITKAFPAPDVDQVSIDDLRGRTVVLEEFQYPTNEFKDIGRQFVFVGSGARGYYYVDLSNRAWLGAYEAVKRYRRFVNQDVPEGMKWTVVGKITDVGLLVPEAGEEKKKALSWGWIVTPEAIWVPDRTFALADPALELGGRFAGEDRMNEIKAPLYTVTAVPDDVTPERLTEIYATAIKEKNFDLYLDCIDPARRATPTGLHYCLYHWDLHQQRFAQLYCHVVVNPARTFVVKGYDPDNSLEARFLTDEEKQKLRELSGPLVEQAELTTVAYDERGRQYGSPKPRFLRRTDKGRWYILNYKQPF